MFLSKEAASKDQQLQTQMVLSFQDDESKNAEKVWQESGFFDDHRSDLTIPKGNFPENTLVYVNQGSVSLVKGGSQAIFLEFVVCRQLMPVANPDLSINLETHVFQENEVLLYVSIYNKATGLYGDLTKKFTSHYTSWRRQRAFLLLWLFKRKKQCDVLYHEDAFAKHLSLYCF